jgi:hypothetical protein
MKMLRGAQIIAVAAACVISDSANAQQWKLGLEGGRIRSALDPSAQRTRNLGLGLSYEDLSSLFRISTGIPTEPDAVYWGAISGWKRLAVSKNGLVGGIEVAGNAFAYRGHSVTTTTGGGLLDPVVTSRHRASGTALAAQALPVVGFNAGPIQLQARAGVSSFLLSSNGQDRRRTVPMGDVQLAFQPDPTFVLTPVVRRYQPHDETASTFAGASAALVQGRVGLWASAGEWISGVDTISGGKEAWTVGAAIGITDRSSITAGARHDSYDPLYLNPPQTSWSVGVSVLLGKSFRKAAPVPAKYENGVATIRLAVTKASTAPRIAGDFNEWKPAPMERDGDSWTFSVKLAPGVYNYSFIAADGTWYVPEGTPGRKDDGMGGHVAVLVVR